MVSGSSDEGKFPMRSTVTAPPATAAHSAAAPAAAPSVHRRALITWLAVYPVITLTLGELGSHIGGLPLLVRTLILTGIVVPAAVYVVIPALLRLNAALTRSGVPRPVLPAPGRGRARSLRQSATPEPTCRPGRRGGGDI